MYTYQPCPVSYMGFHTIPSRQLDLLSGQQLIIYGTGKDSHGSGILYEGSGILYELEPPLSGWSSKAYLSHSKAAIRGPIFR